MDEPWKTSLEPSSESNSALFTSVCKISLHSLHFATRITVNRNCNFLGMRKSKIFGWGCTGDMDSRYWDLSKTFRPIKYIIDEELMPSMPQTADHQRPLIMYCHGDRGNSVTKMIIHVLKKGNSENETSYWWGQWNNLPYAATGSWSSRFLAV
jgi:hypothetical protein